MRIHAVSRWTVLLLAVHSFGAAARDVPLVEAVKAGSAESVRALLDQRADVNVAEADGTTALHWAVQGEAAALVGLLIDAGAGVGAANRYGATPLSVACLTGNAGIIAQLLEAGADANAATAGGRTALMTAARTGHVAAVEVLLAHGADVHATDDTHGQTALMWAAAENNAEVVDTLARAGADVGARTRHGFTALLFAARAGRIEAAKALLAAGAELDEALSNGVTPLLLAITNKNFELAAVLLRAGADPNRDAVGWSALHQLAWSRQPPVGYDNPEPVHRDDVHALYLARQSCRCLSSEAPVWMRPTTPGIRLWRSPRASLNWCSDSSPRPRRAGGRESRRRSRKSRIPISPPRPACGTRPAPRRSGCRHPG